VLAHEWGVPAVQLWPHLAPWDTYEADNAEMLAAMAALPGYVAYERDFAQWLSDNGLGDVSREDFVARPELGLILIPRPTQPFAERVGPPFRFVGPVLDEAREAPGAWTPPAEAAGKRVLLVSLGSAYTDQPAFYRAVLAAFGGDPAWHVVVNVGKTVRPEDLGNVPANVELLPWVPQLQVLARADAFVSHCGMGSTAEALWFGVPVVGVPQAADQFGNADLLVELGVGRRVDTEAATADALREAVEGLLAEDTARARLAELRAQLRREGGAERAADAVEERLADSKVRHVRAPEELLEVR
jgi:MGT family glycosyltransferase